MKTLLIILASVVGFCKAQIVPSLLKDINVGAGNSVTFGNVTSIELGTKFLFVANDPAVTGIEIYITDGSTANTVVLKDINTGTLSSNPGNFFKFNNKVYFSATTASEGSELWVTDGTTAGTTLVKDINVGTSGSSISFIKNSSTSEFYFIASTAANGSELWKSDGTNAGTILIKDINPDVSGSSIGFSQVIESGLGYFYFVANDGTTGQELWKSDGTTANTNLVKDIFPGTGGSLINLLSVINNKLIFWADDGVNGAEMWVSDGTSSGTTLLKDFNGTSANSQVIDNLNIIGTNLYFHKNNMIWKTDGTISGTQSYTFTNMANMLRSNVLKFSNKLYFFNFTQTLTRDTLYLTSFDPAFNSYTVLNKYVIFTGGPTSTSQRMYLQQNLSKFVFVSIKMSGGTLNNLVGISDGTQAGTSITEINGPSFDITYGLSGAGPNPVHFYNNSWYLTQNNILKKLDYNTGVLTVLKSTSPAPTMGGFCPTPQDVNYFVQFGGKLYFRADHSNFGSEIWETDGTAANTNLLLDIRVGTGSPFEIASPCVYKHFYLTSNNVFFAANDGTTGYEIWCFNNTPAGINKKSISNNTSIAPNPFTNELKITATTLISKIEVVDVAGKIIYEGIFNSKEINFETKEFLKGIYIIKIESQDGSVEYKKIVKE